MFILGIMRQRQASKAPNPKYIYTQLFCHHCRMACTWKLFSVDGATIFLLGIMNSLVCNFSTYTEYSIGFYYIFMMPTAIQNDCLARKEWCNTRRLCEQCIIWKRFSQACVKGELAQQKKSLFSQKDSDESEYIWAHNYLGIVSPKWRT